MENKQHNYRQKKRNSQHKKVAEQNNVVNEFQSYSSSYLYSNCYFGFDIFDLYTPEQLKALVRDPMANNKMLRELSLILYGTNGVYTNTVDYLTAMPTLDRVIVTHNKTQSKKNRARNKRNKELMESTLRTIRERERVRNILFCGMIKGSYFGYFETATRPYSKKKMMSDYDVESIKEINEVIEINDNYTNASVITLPLDYTRIVGIKNNSYVIAFNLDYFNNADGETCENKLRKYPKEIRDAYNARYNRNDKNFTGGNWVVLDNNHTIVHKIRSTDEEQWGRPLVLAAIQDILYSDYFTDTKRNVLDEINHRIIVQTLPEGKEKGTSALTKQQQQAQHEAVKSAVVNKNNRNGISFFTVAAGTKINTIDSANTDIFDDKYEPNLNDKISLDLGIAASLLNGSGSGNYSAQQSNLELITGVLFQWVEQITNELNKCIMANIIKDNNNWVECRYLPITHVNKAQMVNYAKDLYLQGKGSLSLWSAACGIPPEVFFALLDQELDANIENVYPVHKTSYTYSEKKAGRPETDNPTQSTIQTRNNGGNDLPSPSDNK